jgi:hypothetical protein
MFILKKIPGIGQLAKYVGGFLSEITAALGWEGQIAKIMISFAIPQEVNSCY